ncbi:MULTISPECIES: tripartite tricarboxylate transporter substrate binding protein [Halomonadaceae]|jgi:putative tricarboxylic transport membrane protein|uniref:Tripartite tricarboxylate transporter substrate binding protein n=1 Tax=Vreelandella piezotolerans TaxID=2609667 RepID=A0ABQ6X6B7_9GAMM|nr:MULTISPECIES: tripartite tricarboxylate transporter substrate binding protein [Halomonas]KAE8437541.1 tripartite tricarboxylate transporter substrate binding protein [Halomonas piezotolerans]MCG7576410.1 tripartite tricarboxylate transporter substrate binding protein [Halomonas sp. MMH1-48]MCG7590664.1 tripartite tricarboxylate transporter substrate binding protein [Halomonas sp. McD50-5]MCG7603473.1 tripartite tricarboxylate transporter substrate binding protein [Halomonas sp. MM17-34]MCG7
MTTLSLKRIAVLALPMAALAMTTAAQAQEWTPSKSIEFIAPANPGGGWDTLVRTMSRVIQQESLADESFAAINVPGGGGAVAWAQVARDSGNPHKLFATSPPMILVPLAGASRYDHTDFTPIARINTDYSIILVAADSEYQTLDDLFEALKANPGLSVGGGSAPGSMDHISMAGLASAAGMEASAVNYIPFSGGGDAMTNLMGGHIEAVIGGAGEAVGQLGEGSQLRALGVSSEERLGGGLADVPTYQEQGYDYTFDIWRGVMGAPEMPEEAVEYYETLFADMLETDAWREASDQLGWIDAYQNSEEFGAFLDEQQEQFSSVLTDLGLLRQ